MPRRVIDRTGERFITTKELGNYEIVIVSHENSHSTFVQFQDSHKAIVHTTYQHCKNGQVKNPYHPCILGVGFIGVGKYVATVNNINTKQYNTWYAMIERCYSDEFKLGHATYEESYASTYFHNFQNFGEWYEENYYEIDNEEMCLDKDILVKGNKMYSPETCVFVPKRINSLFTKNDKCRGDFPIGVSYYEDSDKYMASCHGMFLGYYDTIESAFLVYKNYKEKLIKQVADEYKDKIPKKLYDALYNYEVEITD